MAIPVFLALLLLCLSPTSSLQNPLPQKSDLASSQLLKRISAARNSIKTFVPIQEEDVPDALLEEEDAPDALLVDWTLIEEEFDSSDKNSDRILQQSAALGEKSPSAELDVLEEAIDLVLILPKEHSNEKLVASKNGSSFRDILEQNGLPIGLLPDAVQSFSVSDDGQFEVNLDGSCYAQFEYEVYYAKTITGKISYGTISNLSGTQAKQWFLWVSVSGIRVDVSDSGYIYFEVGSLSKKLSKSQFEQIPDCKRGAMASRPALGALDM